VCEYNLTLKKFTQKPKSMIEYFVVSYQSNTIINEQQKIPKQTDRKDELSRFCRHSTVDRDEHAAAHWRDAAIRSQTAAATDTSNDQQQQHHHHHDNAGNEFEDTKDTKGDARVLFSVRFCAFCVV
jgi:hypothetical protein